MSCSGAWPAPSRPPSSCTTVKTLWIRLNWFTRKRWTEACVCLCEWLCVWEERQGWAGPARLFILFTSPLSSRLIYCLCAALHKQVFSSFYCLVHSWFTITARAGQSHEFLSGFNLTWHLLELSYFSFDMKKGFAGQKSNNAQENALLQEIHRWQKKKKKKMSCLERHSRNLMPQNRDYPALAHTITVLFTLLFNHKLYRLLVNSAVSRCINQIELQLTVRVKSRMRKALCPRTVWPDGLLRPKFLTCQNFNPTIRLAVESVSGVNGLL